MKFARKVAVAINLNHPLPQVLTTLKNLDYLEQCEVHLVHAFLTTTYAVAMGEAALIYPIEDDRKKIEEKVLSELEAISKTILPTAFKGKIIVHCLFSDNPKRRFCQFVDEEHIDLVVVAQREKKGLFESSFSHFINKHTHANMIILKQGAES
jgi:nucleotide-binding universal stress UspA family protein